MVTSPYALYHCLVAANYKYLNLSTAMLVNYFGEILGEIDWRNFQLFHFHYFVWRSWSLLIFSVTLTMCFAVLYTGKLGRRTLLFIHFLCLTLHIFLWTSHCWKFHINQGLFWISSSEEWPQSAGTSRALTATLLVAVTIAIKRSFKLDINLKDETIARRWTWESRKAWQRTLKTWVVWVFSE